MACENVYVEVMYSKDAHIPICKKCVEHMMGMIWIILQDETRTLALNMQHAW